MRRSDHPSRPNAMTCCLFSSLKTLLTSSEGIALAFESTSGMRLSLAGFQVIMYGRFWVITEVGAASGLAEQRTELIPKWPQLFPYKPRLQLIEEGVHQEQRVDLSFREPESRQVELFG